MPAESRDAQQLESIKRWLAQWLADQAALESTDLPDLETTNYFQAGWIDSFGFINFVAEIESEFGVQFSNDDFQDRDFSTIGGLARLILARQQEAAVHD